MSTSNFYGPYIPPWKREGTPTHEDCSRFLRQLQMSGIELSGWATTFVERYVIVLEYSDGQRVVISRLMERYGHRLKHWGLGEKA